MTETMHQPLPFQRRRSSAWLAVLTAGAALICAGCGKVREVAEAKSSGAAQSAAAAPAWDWSRYPETRRMRLGTLPCQLQPRSSITILSPLLGRLRLYVHAAQTNLPAGFLWAEFEPEMFATEKRALEMATQRLNEQEQVQLEIELPRKKLQLERQLKEQERQLRFLRLLSTNPASATILFQFPGAVPLRPDSLENNELEFSLLSRTMDLIQETNLTALGFDLGVQRLQLESRKLDFEKRRAQSRFEMPFDGRLTINLPLTGGVTEYPVNSGQEIGVVRDLSEIRVRVPVANGSWSAIPGGKLSAVVRMPSGEGYEAAFAYRKIERNQNREESVFYFTFPKDRADLAARLIGTEISCELWVNLDEPARVVPKLSLVLQNPEGFQHGTWAAAVQMLFPGARVVAEGQTDLGIVLPKQVAAAGSFQ